MVLLKSIVRLSWGNRFRLLGRLLRDERVPWYAKAVLPLLVVYLAMPLDLIPDFIPVIGELDDLLVLALGGWLFMRLCPPTVVQEHVAALEG